MRRHFAKYLGHTHLAGQVIAYELCCKFDVTALLDMLDIYLNKHTLVVTDGFSRYFTH